MYDVSEIEGGDCKLIVKHNLRNVDTQPIKIQGKIMSQCVPFVPGLIQWHSILINSLVDFR